MKTDSVILVVAGLLINNISAVDASTTYLGNLEGTPVYLSLSKNSMCLR